MCSVLAPFAMKFFHLSCNALESLLPQIFGLEVQNSSLCHFGVYDSIFMGFLKVGKTKLN